MPARPDASPQQPATWSPEATVNPLVRATLYLVAFATPLEYPDRFAYEVTTMAGVLFLLATGTQPRLCYGRIGGPVICFGLWLYVQLFALATQSPQYPAGFFYSEAIRAFQLVLLWVLFFWACSNLFRYEQVARGTLLSLVLGCTVRAALPILGIARSIHVEAHGGARVTVLGQNPNQSAQVLAAGMLILISLVYLRHGTRLGPRLLGWAGVALIAVGLVMTGSRGGLACLTVGLLVFLCSGQTLQARLKNATVALAAAALLGFVAMRSEVMRTRLERSVAEGHMSQREQIFPILVGMFRERPWFGWGPGTNKYELANRLRDPEHGRRDTHNIVLEILTSTGVLGALPFALAVWLCLRSAWAARTGPPGYMPLALALAILAGGMSGNRLSAPLLWMVLAHAGASSAQLSARRRPNRPEVPHPPPRGPVSWRTQLVR